MKIEISEKPKKKEIKYPCLMRSASNNLLVLAGAKEEGGYFSGTVLCLGDSTMWEIGMHYNGWIKDTFELFTGAITLKNSED